MTFKEAKEKLCAENYCSVIETENEIQTIIDDEAYIIYNKKTNEYDVCGFGSPLAFTTYPIYEPWREMIKAWRRENK